MGHWERILKKGARLQLGSILLGRLAPMLVCRLFMDGFTLVEWRDQKLLNLIIVGFAEHGLLIRVHMLLNSCGVDRKRCLYLVLRSRLVLNSLGPKSRNGLWLIGALLVAKADVRQPLLGVGMIAVAHQTRARSFLSLHL